MIDDNSKISLAKTFEVNEIAGDKVMIDFESGKYYMIKGCGNIIFDMLEDEITVGTIIEKLLEEYEIDKESCTKDTYHFLNDMEQKGIIIVK